MPNLGGWYHWDQASTAGSEQNYDLGSKIHPGQALHSTQCCESTPVITSALLKQTARNLSPQPLKFFWKFY